MLSTVQSRCLQILQTKMVMGVYHYRCSESRRLHEACATTIIGTHGNGMIVGKRGTYIHYCIFALWAFTGLQMRKKDISKYVIYCYLIFYTVLLLSVSVII